MEKINTPNFENQPRLGFESMESDPRSEIEALQEAINYQVLDMIRPKNREQAREEFLANDELRRPNFEYTYNNDFFDNKIEEITELYNLINDEKSGLSTRERIIEIEKLEHSARKIQFVEAVYGVQNFEGDKKAFSKAKFEELNNEIWGDFDPQIYRSLMQQELAKIDTDGLGSEGLEVFEELKTLLRENYDGDIEPVFRPSDETFEFVRESAKDFYGELLEGVAEMPTDGYTQEDVATEFQKALDFLKAQGFSQDWNIERPDGRGAIDVNPISKTIKIFKEGKKRKDREALQGVIAHELGVHAMRAEIGASLPDPKYLAGAEGYLDTEEGIARTIEMAIAGKYTQAGIPYYLTVGLAEVEGHDFRQAFEASWRLKVLSSNKNDFSEESIDKARRLAYNRCFRIFRADDNLAWHKDLSYFNGSFKIWKYIEENLGYLGGEAIFDTLFLGGRNNIFDEKQKQEFYDMITSGRHRVFDENDNEVF